MAVWRDTSSGMLKRADGKTHFDPARDRVELVFARLDVPAIRTQPKEAHIITPESQKWVRGLRPSAKDLQALQGLPGALGGSGDYRAGNIVPVYANAKRGVEEIQHTTIAIASRLLTPPPCLVLFACEYPNRGARMPSRVGFITALSQTVSGDFVENKDE